MVNAPYSQAIVVTGYPSASLWSVSSGSLPQGLSLNAGTGAITGTPLARGTYTFTINASNTSRASVSKSFTILVSAPTFPDNTDIIHDFGTWSGQGERTAYLSLAAADFLALKSLNSGTLVPGQDYYITPGSTYITFREAYLQSLANGVYRYIAEYTQYDTHEIRLVIANQNPGDNNNNNDNNSNNNNNNVTGGAGEGGGGSPSTGDDPYMLFLTTMLAIVSALCLFMLMLYYRYTHSSLRTRKR